MSGKKKREEQQSSSASSSLTNHLNTLVHFLTTRLHFRRDKGSSIFTIKLISTQSQLYSVNCIGSNCHHQFQPLTTHLTPSELTQDIL